MTIILMSLDYENLAEGELGRAGRCSTAECRVRHLDRAAVYAHRAEGAARGSSRSREALVLLGDLSAALDAADDLGSTTAVLQIDQAIVHLGGIGEPPAVWPRLGSTRRRSAGRDASIGLSPVWNS